MPSFNLPIGVEMEDGATWTATADQRDLAAYEVQPFYNSGPHTQTRFLAWAASRRAKQTALAWDLFNAACVEANSSVAERVDPTNPDQPAES